MEQERARASALGYPDPINPDYEATTQMYHKTLTECLRRIKVRTTTKKKLERDISTRHSSLRLYNNPLFHLPGIERPRRGGQSYWYYGCIAQ